jgi:hypothetical protein
MTTPSASFHRITPRDNTDGDVPFEATPTASHKE